MFPEERNRCATVNVLLFTTAQEVILPDLTVA